MLAGVLERQIVFGQLFRLEWLLQTCLAQRAESETRLLDLDQADLAERVPAVKIARYALVAVKVLVARGTLHLTIKNS